MTSKLKHLTWLGLFAALLTLGLSSVQAQGKLPSIAPPVISPEEGKTYFTRVSFFHEKNTHQATNFSRGELMPINTEVKLVSMSDRRGGRFVLERADNGQTVTIANIPKHTSITVEELASRMLADRKTPIERLSEKFQNAVKSGQLAMGMNREIALMARGYPPTTHTPSLEMDTWKYQVNRFAVHTIVFNNGVITEGRDLK